MERRAPVLSGLVLAVLNTLLAAGKCMPATTATGRDFVLALDTSGSMHAQAKRTVLSMMGIQLVEKLLAPGDGFSLITFTKQAKLVGQWQVSDDKGDLLIAIARVQPTTDGWTNIEAAKTLAISTFKKAAQDSGKEQRGQYLLLLTDGEATHTLTASDSLYTLWQAEQRNLHRIVSFGKSGVTLTLFAFGVPLGQETVIPKLPPDGEISTWMDQLRKQLRAVGGSIGQDIKEHLEDGLQIAPTSSQLVDQRHVFEADKVGLRERFTLRSHFEVAYAKGELKAGLTELHSTVLGRRTGSDCDIDFYATAGTGTAFELGPHPTDENPEEAKTASRPWEQSFDLVVRLPQPRFPLTLREKVTGTIAFTADGTLSEFGEQQGGAGPASISLPQNLPVPSQVSFMAERDLDITYTIVAAVIIALALSLLGWSTHTALRSNTVQISDVSGAEERVFRIAWRQPISIGSDEAPTTYRIAAEGAHAVLRRTLSGKLLLRATQGRLYSNDMPVDEIRVGAGETIGLSSTERDHPEVTLNIAAVTPAGGPSSGEEDTFDWSS